MISDIEFVMVLFGLLFLAIVALLYLVVQVRREMWRPRQIEDYARCTVRYDGVIVEPGVEWRDEDDLEQLTRKLEYLAELIGRRCGEMAPRAAIKSAQRDIMTEWPGRHWFVEIHDGIAGRWVQSYQPPRIYG